MSCLLEEDIDTLIEEDEDAIVEAVSYTHLIDRPISGDFEFSLLVIPRPGRCV